MRFTVMDRRSFINQNSLQNAGRCNSEVCECDEAGVLKTSNFKKIEPYHLAAITILAFISAAAISSITKGGLMRAEIISEKNQNIISCSPNANEEILNDDRRPVDGNNGNSCSHQVGAVGILYLNNSNHKKNHVC
jgi:hypothetical protein